MYSRFFPWRSSNTLFALATMSLCLATPDLAQAACQHPSGCLACYSNAGGFTGPWNPPPEYIDVYWDPDPAHVAAGGFGTNPNSMTEAQAQHLIRQWVGKFDGEAGSDLRLRWRSGAPPHDCTSVIGNPNPFVRITTVDNINGGSAALWTLTKTGTQRMHCARMAYEEDIRWIFRGDQRSYTTVPPGPNGQDIISLFAHEIGHAFRWRHANDPICDGTPAEDNDQNTGSGVGQPRSGWKLNAAEKSYLAFDYGELSLSARQVVGTGGFPPQSWGWDYGIGWGVRSPITATDGDDPYNGYAFLKPGALQPEVTASFFEPGGMNLERTLGTSWHRPDIARTIGMAQNSWIVAWLVGDTPEDRVADIRIAERALGSNPAQYSLDDLGIETPFNHVAVAYDPSLRLYYITWLDDLMRVRVSWRYASLPGWQWNDISFLGAMPDIAAMDGADIACSQFQSSSGRNCILVYAEIDGNNRPVLHYTRFGWNGAQMVFDAPRSLGFLGYTRPSVTANPLNAEPQFYIAFDQAGGVVYTRGLETDNTVVGGTPYFPPNANRWLRPAGLGTWMNGNTPMVDLVITE